MRTTRVRLRGLPPPGIEPEAFESEGIGLVSERKYGSGCAAPLICHHYKKGKRGAKGSHRNK